MSIEQLQLSDYHIDIPTSLIAQHPLPDRAASRLMALNATEPGSIAHHQFDQLPQLLRRGDLLVLNNTRVIPARLHGHKETGGRVEILLERVLPPQQLLVMIKASKSPAPGSQIVLGGGRRVEVMGRQDNFFVLDIGDDVDPFTLLEEQGQVPLPPYIERAPEADDQQRYQTIYGVEPGAVAAPTAGLHFDDSIFERLEAMGVSRTFVTLHVGAGTFQPVRVENPEDHVMHSEYVDVPQSAVDAVNQTRQSGGRIIAVGTTSVRCLESAARFGAGGSEPDQSKVDRFERELVSWSGDTRLFLRPGSEFQQVDGMLTNFHLPQSTLMMLVSAFAGHRNIMHAYRCAVESQYRFYSYGDAMLLWPAHST